MRSLRFIVIGAFAFVVTLGAACDRDTKSNQGAQEQAAVARDAVGAATAIPSPIAGAVPPGVIKDPTFAALRGATAEYGVLDGAAYRIEVPENWNGGLVMYAHGYRGEGGELSVSNPEIRQHLISRGYAWAASSYRANSYRPDYGVVDTLALRELFIQRHGQPRWTILQGTSMGGHVLTASLEQRPGVYQAGLAQCGALTGIGQIDYLAAYGAAAEYIGGVELFNAPDATSFVRRILNEWLPEVGFGQTPTQKGLAFQSVVKYLMGGDLPFWREGLAARFTQLVNLVTLADPDRQSSPVGRSVDTRDVIYKVDPGLGVTSEELNQGVRRFAPAPGSRSASDNAVFAEFTGRISVPVISLHTTGDAFVPFSVEQEYRQKVEESGAGDLLVQRAIRRPNHCEFNRGEITQAFDDLVRWLEQGVKPEGENVLSADLSTLGLKWTSPLRPDDPAR